MIKIFLILAYLVSDYASVIDRIRSIDGIVPLGVFSMLYACVAASLVLCAFIRNHTLRIALAVIFALASILQHSFEWTTDGTLTYAAFVNLYQANGQIGDAIAQHGRVLVEVTLQALLLLFGIALPGRPFRFHPRLALAAPVLATGLLSSMLYARGGEGAGALPAYPALSMAGLMAGQNLLENDGPRETAVLPRAAPRPAKDIVLIVDESVSGNYLDINNRQGVRSGLADERPGVRITNFGYAASISKCSATSNVVLRYGGTQQTYREAVARWPSIWRQAKAVGMRTVYLDGQSNNGALQNLMTADERAEIDDFIQFDGVPIVDRDMRIAALIAQRINNGRPELIYVNKVGAHFPINDKYPESRTRYQPAFERGKPLLVSWTSDRTGFTGKPEEWVRYRNSYRNTLLWNVGEFFDRLLTQADLSKATILYTSDHGQDLHERGNPGNNTHCGAENAQQEEGLVPLAVIEGAGAASLDWAKHLDANRDKMSAFRIVPTLLALMGYDRGAIADRYGLALDQGGSDSFAYNVYFKPLLGKPPEYRAIDLAKMVNPPDTDYTALGRRE